MVERADGTAAFQTLSTVPFDTVQYHDGAVTPGATYKYRVMAMPKEGGHSEATEYSNEVTFVAPEAETDPDPAPRAGVRPDIKSGVPHPQFAVQSDERD
ncbi:MAG TPA: hypothetical protein VIM73_10620 [Polyangiaceae bacterium]